MAEKKSNGKKYGLAALVLFLIGGGGYGLGTGAFGFGEGTGLHPTSNTTEVSEKQNETETEEIPDTIVIRIAENEVTVNGKVCADAKELKSYLEKVYSDNRIFILEDENAILASYEWVEETCSDLGIDLKK